MGGRYGEKEVLLLFIKLYDSVQSCVYLLERLQHGCSVPFILGLFDLRMINTINYILRDLVGFLALLYITFDYRGIIRKTHALDEKLYAVCAAVIICNYLLMTVASRVLMAAFGRIPEKFFFLGIGILCLTGYLIAGISISKALFDKEMKILSWIVAGVLIVVLLVMRDQYFIWRLIMAFNSAVLLGGAFYIRKKPL